jgi:hypothetical protein
MSAVGTPGTAWPARPEAGLPVRPRPPADQVTRLLGWSSAAGIGSALLVMIVVAVGGPSRAVVHLPGPQPGPPWWLPMHPDATLVAVSLWSAVIVGAAGVGAGLAAVARGARPPVRLLVGVALAVAALFTVTPSAGSTDTLDYAAYGRMVVIGHDPYLMTPAQLRRLGDPVGLAAPRPWQHAHSVYGPLATLEQAAAAELGGTSVGRIIFWLKLWNVLAFGAVVLALDRLLRRDPVRRARAHLLWSVNPLLLWVLVAGGHVDAVAAAIGFAGLLVIGPRPGSRQAGKPGIAGKPGLARAAAAGALVGAATDLKVTFVLFGVGLAWAARRSPAALLAAAAAGLAVLVPSYLWFGPPAVTVLLDHGNATMDNLYRMVWHGFGHGGDVPGLMVVALPVFAAVALLLLWRLPDGGQASARALPRLAAHLALPAGLVRRDGVLPDRALPRHPARLAAARPAGGRHPLLDSRHAGPPAGPLAERDQPLGHVACRAACAAAGAGRGGGTVPDRRLVRRPAAAAQAPAAAAAPRLSARARGVSGRRTGGGGRAPAAPATAGARPAPPYAAGSRRSAGRPGRG